MIRVLIAAAPAEAEGLREAFTAGFGGHAELELVGGALYALTSLERCRADLVVSADVLGDMTGRDLYSLVNDDEALQQIPFVLLSADSQDIVPLPRHALLNAHAAPAEVLAAAFTLLVAAGTLAEPKRSGGASRNTKLAGTFEALTLFDLLTSLGHGRRSGQLVVSLGDAEAVLHLDEGSLVHAHLGRTNGEEAVLAIFAEVERRPESGFVFLATDATGGLVTILAPLDKLLLQAAVALDEQKRVAV